MKPVGIQIVATNRQASHRYTLSDEFEAGLVLRGSEVKSVREGKVQISEGYGDFDGDEVYLAGVHIPQWLTSQSHNGHDEMRRRKLLMHRREIDRLLKKRQTERIMLIPTRMYFRDGKVKVEMALAKPKKSIDRRQEIAKRDADRDARRELVHRQGSR